MRYKPVRLGLVGLGQQMLGNLVPAVSLSNLSQIAALCDIEAEPLRAASQMLGVSSTYSDIDMMLENEELDAVICASSPATHELVLNRCIAHGVAAFVEKPAGSLSSSILDLKARSDLAGTLIGVGLNFRFSRAVAEFNSLIATGDYGQPKHISARYYCRGRDYGSWSLDNDILSFLLAEAIHPIDLIHHLLDDVLLTDSVVRSSEGLSISISGIAADDASWAVHVSNLGPRFAFEVDILTNRSVMFRLTLPHTVEVQSPSSHGTLQGGMLRIPPKAMDSGYVTAGYQPELEEFLRCVSAGTVFSPCLGDFLNALNVIETAMQVSSATPVFQRVGTAA
jgi:phthalate 4,5-cis-dihydrodiol dehydrogenase